MKHQLEKAYQELKAQTLLAINQAFPKPEERFPEYVMLVFNVPIQKEYGVIACIIREEADGSLWLMDDNDTKQRVDDFPDLETIIFILGVIEDKKYTVIE